MTSQPRGTAILSKIDSPPLLQQRLSPPKTLAPWRIILYIGKTETVTAMRLDVDGLLTVGRADLVEKFIPGVDLGPFGGQDAGVSRRHALLWGTDDGLYIRDLESTNGTYINGFRLQPKQPYKLRNNDKIEVGQMHIVVQIINAPTL
jgi:pSer/pThr/pTyr-binding forkhead associated (FHA) protein